MSNNALEDGLTTLRRELALSEIMRLIERTAKWVGPETFRLLPLWYPEHARKKQLHNKDWSERRQNKRGQSDAVDKLEGNTQANKALTYALGLSSKQRPNWSCCHIWGRDDAQFQLPNVVVQDHRYFSCVANMVLLPTPLKAFTDAMPEVKIMLRICAWHLYGWHCDHAEVAESVERMKAWNDWTAYPATWPRAGSNSAPMGVMSLTPVVRKRARKRISDIRHDLKNAGPLYPREEVRAAMAYWKLAI